MADNLIGWIDGLSDFEKAFLIRCVKMYHPDMNLHLGSLPFLNRPLALGALRGVVFGTPDSADSRKAKKILGEFGETEHQAAQFTMHLDNLQVYKRSRATANRDERLMTLGIKKKSTAGQSYNAFRRKYERQEMVVNHQIILTKGKHNIWSIECDTAIVDQAKEHLFVHCHRPNNKPSRKKFG